jgi:hypothetical protein
MKSHLLLVRQPSWNISFRDPIGEIAANGRKSRFALNLINATRLMAQ